MSDAKYPGCCGDDAWRGRLCPYHDGYEDGRDEALAGTQFCPRCEDYAQRVVLLEASLREVVGAWETNVTLGVRDRLRFDVALARARSVLGAGVPE